MASLVLVIIFILQNLQGVFVSFLILHGQIPLGAALLVAATLGGVVLAAVRPASSSFAALVAEDDAGQIADNSWVSTQNYSSAGVSPGSVVSAADGGGPKAQMPAFDHLDASHVVGTLLCGPRLCHSMGSAPNRVGAPLSWPASPPNTSRATRDGRA